MVCKEAVELITALVDDELSDPERKAIQSHMSDCADCRGLYEQERELKRHLHALGTRVVAPATLKQRILADPRIFPQTAGSPRRWIEFIRPARVLARPAFALALVILFVMPVYYLMSPSTSSIPLAALQTHAALDSGELPFTRDATAEETVERLVRSVQGRFSPMGFDLSAAGLRPVGGMLLQGSDREVLIAVYRGDAPSVTCFTFIGTEEDAPPGARLYMDAAKKTNYYAFTDGAVNGVVHRVGDRVCLLVSAMPMERLLTLVRALPHPNGR